jgi:hypothetical protein
VFADTAFAGAAALLAVIGLFGAVASFRAMRQLQRADAAVETAERKAITAASKNPIEERRGIASRMNENGVPTEDARRTRTIEEKKPQYQASLPSDAEMAKLVQNEPAATEASELVDTNVPAQARGTDKTSATKARASEDVLAIGRPRRAPARFPP